MSLCMSRLETVKHTLNLTLKSLLENVDHVPKSLDLVLTYNPILLCYLHSKLVVARGKGEKKR